MILHPDDTIVALSSPPGPGARAIIRLTGPSIQAVLSPIFTPQSPSAHDTIPADWQRQARRRYLGEFHLRALPQPIPAILDLWPAPRTYTGQDLAEIHLLSSPPLVQAVIAECLSRGARAAGPGEFTLRAFLAGKKDLPQAEAVLAVIEARDQADLQTALTQLAGGLSQPLSQLRNDLLNLLADVEAGLDFVEEDIQFISQNELLTRIAAGIAHLINLRRQLQLRSLVDQSFRVVLVGQPNAGKSSLFNALLGQESALVSPIAGTTRDYLSAQLELNGVAVELIDTAGWQEAATSIDAQAQQLGEEQSRTADIVLWCVPATEPLPGSVPAWLQARPTNTVLIVRTKSDLIADAPATDDALASIRSCPATVLRPEGTARLREVLTTMVHLLARPALAPSLSRCHAHVEAALQALTTAHAQALHDDPAELLALSLRQALQQIGEMIGEVHTDDLLDRIFSRFCIGK